MNDTSGEQADDIWLRLKQRFTLCQRDFASGQRKAYGESKRGDGMKRSVRIYLRREDCEGCGRQAGGKINIWMQNGKHDMLSTQLRKNAEKEKFASVKDNKENIFCVAKQMQTENQDVMREKYMR